MVEVKRLCDCCGEKMPPTKNIQELFTSATKEWNMKLFDICESLIFKACKWEKLTTTANILPLKVLKYRPDSIRE